MAKLVNYLSFLISEIDDRACLKIRLDFSNLTDHYCLIVHAINIRTADDQLIHIELLDLLTVVLFRRETKRDAL